MKKLLAKFRQPPRFVNPRVGDVNWGDLRRLDPVRRDCGAGRGRPVDRVYIERFLSRHSASVRGRVLEFKDDGYTKRFGGDRVTQSDVVDLDPKHRPATIIADITREGSLPADTYNCIICTQVLSQILDGKAAVRTLRGALKPGGALVVTVPGIQKLVRDAQGRPADRWRFTRKSLDLLLGEFFPPSHLLVETYGNVLTAVALLQGISAEELGPDELNYSDPNYPLVIAAHAIRPGEVLSQP